MPVKQFEIGTADYLFDSDHRLVVELGNRHVACLVHTGQRSCIAIELFTHTDAEAHDVEKLLNSVTGLSRLLPINFTNSRVYVNNELAVLVPSYKFNKEIAEDYLRIALGEDDDYVKMFEAIQTDPVIMNVFRIPAEWLQVLQQRFSVKTIHHSYTSILSRNIQAELGDVLFVQFYHSHIIVSAYRQGQLLLIRSFDYASPDDVVYYLLHLCRQPGFAGAAFALRVSGMIEQESNLYRELVKYFEDVEPELPAKNEYANGTQFPAHYFTPVCKLAV